MAGGMDLLMGPGGIEGRRRIKAGPLRQLDAIKLGQACRNRLWKPILAFLLDYITAKGDASLF